MFINFRWTLFKIQNARKIIDENSNKIAGKLINWLHFVNLLILIENKCFKIQCERLKCNECLQRRSMDLNF